MLPAFPPVCARLVPLSAATPTQAVSSTTPGATTPAVCQDAIVQAISSACRDASGALENPVARLLMDFRDAFAFALSWFGQGCSAEVLLAAAMGVFASEPACVVAHEMRRGGSVFRVAARRLSGRPTGRGPGDPGWVSTVVPYPPSMPERDFMGFPFVAAECLHAYPSPATPAPNPIAQTQAACNFLSTWRTARRDPVALVSALAVVARHNPRVAWFVDVDHLGDAFPVSEFVWVNFWIPCAPSPTLPLSSVLPSIAPVSHAVASTAAPPPTHAPTISQDPSRDEPERRAATGPPTVSNPPVETAGRTFVHVVGPTETTPTAVDAAVNGGRSEGPRKRPRVGSTPTDDGASSTDRAATEPRVRSDRGISKAFGEKIARGLYRRDDFCAGLMALLGDREELGDPAGVAEAIGYFEGRMREAGVVTDVESATILECASVLKASARHSPIDAEMIRGWRTMLTGQDVRAAGEAWTTRRSMLGYLFLSFGEILRGHTVPTRIGATILRGLGMSVEHFRNACRIGALLAKRPRLLCASRLQTGMLKALRCPLTTETPDDEGLECLRLYCAIPTSPPDDAREATTATTPSTTTSTPEIPGSRPPTSPGASDPPKHESEAWDREVEMLKAMESARTDLEASVHHVCLDAECRSNPGMRAARLVATLVVSLDLESRLDPERKQTYLFCLESMARGRIPHDGTDGGDVEAACRRFFSTALDTYRRATDAARSRPGSDESRFLRRAACLLAHAPWILTTADLAPLALRHCVEAVESFDRLEALREEGRLLLLYPKLVAAPGDLRIDFLRRMDRATVGSVLEPGALDCLVAYSRAFSRLPSQRPAAHEPRVTSPPPSDASRTDLRGSDPERSIDVS